MTTLSPAPVWCAVALTILLTGCQSPTDEEWAAFCQNDKWTEHGYFDATQGFQFKIARGYQERCGEDFSKEEMAQYQRGFIRGLHDFCTEEKGYELGLKGRPNPESCPPELEKPFLAGYQKGRGDDIQNQILVVQQEMDREKERFFDRPPPMIETMGDMKQ